MAFQFKPVNVDLTISNKMAIYRNSEWHLDMSLSLRDSVTKEEEPYDLSGMSGIMQIKQYCGDTYQVVSEPTVEVDGETGAIHASLRDDETMEIGASGKYWDSVSEYCYDLYLCEGEKKYRICHGVIEVSPNVVVEEE